MQPHISASRNILRERLHRDKQARLDGASPSRDIFRKTASLIAALRKLGCTASLCELTLLSPKERELRDRVLSHQAKLQRGYVAAKEKCEGRILFRYRERSTPFIWYVIMTFSSPCSIVTTHSAASITANTARITLLTFPLVMDHMIPAI